MRLQTPDGPREIWGKDIERAVAKSPTQPQIGDKVILQRTGRDAVTVKRQERNAQGQLSTKEIDAYCNRWVIEKKQFFEQRAVAAEILRNEKIEPREAVRKHPELAARALRDPQDQRRFLGQVRRAFADEIEQGEPLPPVRLRERAAARRAKDPRLVSRE